MPLPSQWRSQFSLLHLLSRQTRALYQILLKKMPIVSVDNSKFASYEMDKKSVVFRWGWVGSSETGWRHVKVPDQNVIFLKLSKKKTLKSKKYTFTVRSFRITAEWRQTHPRISRYTVATMWHHIINHILKIITTRSLNCTITFLFCAIIILTFFFFF